MCSISIHSLSLLAKHTTQKLLEQFGECTEQSTIFDMRNQIQPSLRTIKCGDVACDLNET